MMKSSFTLMAAVLFCLLSAASEAATVPMTVTHQGRLMNGATPANGFFDIEYDIYPSATGGTSLWTETHTNVEVKDGLFTAELGKTSGFFDICCYDTEMWLQIHVVGDPTPISPRTKLGGSPFSVMSHSVGSSRPIPGSLDTAKIDMQTTSTGSSLRLRVVPTAQTTGRGVSMGATQQGGEIAIGDPDFDLLRMTGDATGANMSITGDPDFDLLRMSADADSAKIRISGQSIGDPDFDLLRLTGGGGVGEIKISGDPDFDLLRLSANADSAEISMSGQVIGDPDFDLLRMIGKPKFGDITMKVKNSIGNIRGITTEVDSQTARYHQWNWNSGSVKREMIELSSDSMTGAMTISNGEGTRGLAMRADSGGGSIAIEEEGVQKIKMNTDSGHAEIAIEEEGVQITMRADSGGGGGIAIGEEGVQKIRMDTDSGSSNIAVNEDGTHNITISSDSGSSSIAVNEEGTHNITIRIDSGGGSFAINEPGVGKKVSLDSDGDGYLSNSLKIGTTSGTNHIEVVGGANCDGTTWNNASDAASKENFQQIDGEQILEKIESLDITRWNYIGKEDAEHIGPTAQDFYKAFGVGVGDKTISTVDPSGIALAAIKELYKKSKEVDELKRQLEELSKAVEKLAKERK